MKRNNNKRIIDQNQQYIVLDYIKELTMGNEPLFKDEDKMYCPHCGSESVVGNGNYKNRKRYVCKDCRKSFNDLTGTVCSYIQDKEKFLRYTEIMLTGRSLRKLAIDMDISLNTALIWKHKILNIIDFMDMKLKLNHKNTYNHYFEKTA